MKKSTLKILMLMAGLMTGVAITTPSCSKKENDPKSKQKDKEDDKKDKKDDPNDKDTATWINLGTVGYLGEFTKNDFQMVVDNNEVPYVVYRNANYECEVQRLNGTSWEKVGNIVVDGYVGLNGYALKVDKINNLIYVACMAANSENVNRVGIFVKKLEGETWTDVGHIQTDQLNPTSISLAIDLDGAPVVIYGYGERISGTNRKVPIIQVARFDGNKWVDVLDQNGNKKFGAGIETAYGGSPGVLEADISPSRYLHILSTYGGAYGSTGHELIISFNPTLPHKKTTFSHDMSPQDMSILFDKNDNRYFSRTENKSKYERHKYIRVNLLEAGNKYGGIPIYDSSAMGGASRTTLAMDAKGVLYLGGGRRIVKYTTAKEWVHVRQFEEVLREQEASLTIAIGKNSNVVYAAFASESDNKKITVMKQTK